MVDPVILIFGGLAAFFIFKLLSALGENSGEPDSQRDGGNDFDALRNALSNTVKKSQGTPLDDDADEELTEFQDAPAPARTFSEAGEALLAGDPNFDEHAFLEGAKSAYEMIVEAFARGDLSGVRQFLGDSVFNAFKSAIANRENAKHQVDLKFVGIDAADLFKATVSDDAMTAVTDFSSNQVRVTHDADGNVVDGDPNRIDLVKDRWTFTRKRGSKDPNWVLVATGAAG